MKLDEHRTILSKWPKNSTLWKPWKPFWWGDKTSLMEDSHFWNCQILNVHKFIQYQYLPAMSTPEVESPPPFFRSRLDSLGALHFRGVATREPTVESHSEPIGIKSCSKCCLTRFRLGDTLFLAIFLIIGTLHFVKWILSLSYSDGTCFFCRCPVVAFKHSSLQ